MSREMPISVKRVSYQIFASIKKIFRPYTYICEYLRMYSCNVIQYPVFLQAVAM